MIPDAERRAWLDGLRVGDEVVEVSTEDGVPLRVSRVAYATPTTIAVGGSRRCYRQKDGRSSRATAGREIVPPTAAARAVIAHVAQHQETTARIGPSRLPHVVCGTGPHCPAQALLCDVDGCDAQHPNQCGTCCPAPWLCFKHQAEKLRREGLARASRLSVEECVYWMVVVTAARSASGLEREVDAIAFRATARDSHALRFWERTYTADAREELQHRDRRAATRRARIYATMALLCREAARAIEEERRG